MILFSTTFLKHSPVIGGKIWGQIQWGYFRWQSANQRTCFFSSQLMMIITTTITTISHRVVLATMVATHREKNTSYTLHTPAS